MLFPFLSGLESLSASYSGLKLPNSNGGVGDGGVSKFLVAVLITGNCIGGGEFVWTLIGTLGGDKGLIEMLLIVLRLRMNSLSITSLSSPFSEFVLSGSGVDGKSL